MPKAIIDADEIKANLRVSGLYKLGVRTIAYASSLGDIELRIVLFIFLRTLAFNDTWKEIPEREFLEGHFWGGKLIAPPVGCGILSLRLALKRLERKRVIIRLKGDHRGAFYSLNIDWKPSGMRELFFLQEHDFQDPISECDRSPVEGSELAAALWIVKRAAGRRVRTIRQS